MQEDEYNRIISEISYIGWKYGIDARDVAHSMFAENGHIDTNSTVVNRIMLKEKMNSRNTVCCGGIDDIEWNVLLLNKTAIPEIYKYCPGCNDQFPEREFRNNNGFPYKICKRCENGKGRVRNSKHHIVNGRRSKAKSRDNLTDAYIRDILRKQGTEITQENIDDKRASILNKRKAKYLQNIVLSL